MIAVEVAMDGIERITRGDDVYAIVLRSRFQETGTHFFTPGEFSQQLGMLVHPKGKVVGRHRHRPVRREVFRTQEVLVVLDGRLEVEIFDDDVELLETVILEPGDAVLLARGGHRIAVLEACKMIEVKQGPYAGGDDKDFF